MSEGRDPERPRVLIVGGGLAGAALAFRLTQAGMPDVTLLEREAVPGVHASGQNAAMVRRICAEPAIAALARAGADFIAEPDAFTEPLAFRQTGSLLLGLGESWDRLVDAADEARRHGVALEMLTPTAVRARLPWLEHARCTGGVLCPADGVVDVAGLLSGYLREARSKGATILFGEEVVRIERPVEGGEINRVVTSTGRTFEPEVLVCTGGAWAASLARLAGAAPPPMRPLLRHLFHTEPGGEVDPMAPWVWDEGHGWYARPETGGFLLCACDEVPSEPCLPITDPAAEEHLAAVLTEHAPSLTGLPLARRWAGLRTFAPDRSFVIGWDADVPGLFWLSGLGGHGVTTSAAVGALAARLLQEGPGAEHPAFSPARSA